MNRIKEYLWFVMNGILLAGALAVTGLMQGNSTAISPAASSTAPITPVATTTGATTGIASPTASAPSSTAGAVSAVTVPREHEGTERYRDE